VSTSRILPTAGYVNVTALPKGPNGRALCRYCGREVPKGRQSFCSGEKAKFVYRTGALLTPGAGCVHEHCVRSQPRYARQCVWARDLGRCAGCGKIATHPNASHEWQADHIVPVVEGGGACGLENYRTLCTGCHRVETAKLRARRAAAKVDEEWRKR
jgi:5-methylcytosine-specific restriction enzyme A